MMTAGVEAMFLQVLLPSNNCCFLRFLWRDFISHPIQVCEYTRHICGAKNSPTCANFALQQTARDNGNTFPNVSAVIERFFYMDFTKSVKTTD